MTRTQIYLPQEMILDIKLQAKKRGLNMSELIRQILDNNLKNAYNINDLNIKKANRLKTIGAIKPSENSNKDSATNHNDIYK